MRKFLAFYRVSVQDTLTYRGPIVIWLLGNVLALVVSIAVWYSSQARGATLGGYTRNEIVTYYWLGLFFQWLLNWFPFNYVRDEIADGTIVGSTLVKPVSYFMKNLARDAGWHTVGTVAGFLATLLVGLFIRDYLVLPGSVQIFPLILALVLAVLVTFSFSLCLGMIAFWTIHVGAIDSLFWVGRIFLGGLGIPISFFSGWFLGLITWLPFRYMFSFPLEIYLGKLTAGEMFFGFWLQIAWVVILVAVYKFLFEKGRAVYTSFGQ